MNDYNSQFNGARILRFNHETGITIIAGNTSLEIIIIKKE